MTEIHPGILAHSEEEFIAKAARVASIDGMLHIDVMDGVFVPNTTWAPPERMHELLNGRPFEAHLMVANPEHAVPIWIAAGAERVIYHLESTVHHRTIKDSAADCPHDCICIAFNPETPISAVAPILNDVGSVLIMGVKPGWSGQAMDADTADKVRELKRVRSSMIVGVDGGVKADNVRMLKDAGADFVIATSALTDVSDPEAALLELKKALL